MRCRARDAPWALQVWVPDSPDGNRLAKSDRKPCSVRSNSEPRPWMFTGPIAACRRRQLRAMHAVTLCRCVSPNRGVAYVGSGPAVGALSLHVGGRARMRVSTEAPSRAAMKLEEAIDWLGLGPAAGELCVDLGAAPGGWSYVVLERGARVIAIDPGAMAPNLAKRRGLVHIRGSAFDFEPREPVDWLLCDMVWRPLEVAALLARWSAGSGGRGSSSRTSSFRCAPRSTSSSVFAACSRARWMDCDSFPPALSRPRRGHAHGALRGVGPHPRLHRLYRSPLPHTAPTQPRSAGGVRGEGSLAPRCTEHAGGIAGV